MGKNELTFMKLTSFHYIQPEDGMRKISTGKDRNATALCNGMYLEHFVYSQRLDHVDGLDLINTLQS